MVTSSDCINKYGLPTVQMEHRHMVLWDVPKDINEAMPALPNKIYCNKDLVKPLEKALRLVMSRCLCNEIETWDGCFNIRKKRGYKSFSLHSWAIAIDINAARNGLGRKPQMSAYLVRCFTEVGFDWGGTWKRQDGMHFQLSKI